VSRRALLRERRKSLGSIGPRKESVAVTASESLQFYKLAKYYDTMVAKKDYRSESRRLESLARRYSQSGGRSWLDVACGTGRHLAFLRRKHAVCGVDLSPEMLRVAHRRLPGVRLVRADMRKFRLGQQFDVVTCLYSAIGHLRTERDLRQAFANLARHAKPGGVVIVEPWIAPNEFHREMIHLVTHRDREGVFVRLAYSRRRGNHSVIRYHYLIGEPHRRIRHLEETDVGLLVSRERLADIMESVGLRARIVRRGLPSGRGLILGVKPVSGG
jgi:ubiquinone/menaquinone biosynthesis C-methylase UbiE